MRDDPALERGAIAACLAAHYELVVSSITFLPIGHDSRASVYKIVTRDERGYFLKIRSDPVIEPGLRVPRALIDQGIPNILAPLRTWASALWAPLGGDDGHSVILYPFVQGDNAKVVGLSAEQWREFGATLWAVHRSGLEARFRGQLRTETFALPSTALVRQIMATLDAPPVESATAARLASFLRGNSDQIEAMLARAEELGRALQTKRFEMHLCHADIHTANILVDDDGRIWLIDWDGPLIAPRERDLLFVIGSRIARPVSPDDEDRFFDGYGPVEIDPDALIYYRYERIIEDLGEFSRVVLLEKDVSESTRRNEAELAMSFFAADSDLARAEMVPRLRWPRSG